MNIANWIEKWAVSTPAQIAIRFEDTAISYPELDARIKANACALRGELGIRPGDRIAYLGQNDPQMLVLLFACARLGAIFLPLNWRLAPLEHARILADSGASVLFVDEPYIEQCETLRGELGDRVLVAVRGEPGRGWRTLAGLLRQAGGDDGHPDIGLDSPLLLVYTSGTTGFPKGAVLTQEALWCNAINSTVMHDLASTDIVLTFLPLFHVGGLNNQTMPAFHAGATVILHRVFDPQRVLSGLVHERATLTIVLPAHMPLLRALPGWEAADFSSLRGVLTGSTKIPDEMVKYWHGRGIPLLQMYGATETGPIAIHQRISNAFQTAGTIGYPALHCEVRVADDAGRDCAAGEPGEILVRGRGVMACYWNNDVATRASVQDGWFHTGDIGYVDDKGCYHFVDRKKDVIISGGENIYPAEIENLLMSHPAILEVAIVGREDPRWGEIPVAVVVSKDACSLGGEDVLGWLNGKLGRFKHPRDVVFVESLPRNEMRKVMKDVLRDMVKGPRA
ncbi:MAG: AMP-binding protein [Gammaproteobacteria bacterium]|nr:AMP-binding protein [Gammaproteobacteria bacterium]